jgi:surfeit locus 1 family protein
MLRSLRQNGLLGSAIATAIAFAMLMALGTWQMQRKAWKEGLLAQIAERTHAPPVPLADVLSNMTATFETPYDPEYTRVSVSGRFHYDKEQFLWAPDPDAGPGYYVYTPLEYAPNTVVWVNRGFVPIEKKAPDTRAAGQVAGDVTVTGLVRRPIVDKGTFTPDNEPQHQMYYWRSLGEMHAAAFGNSAVAKAPLFIDADAEPANPGGLPKGGVTLVDLPNRHLEYAITWYGLGGTLLAVYAAFVAGRLRRPKIDPNGPEIR